MPSVPQSAVLAHREGILPGRAASRGRVDANHVDRARIRWTRGRALQGLHHAVGPDVGLSVKVLLRLGDLVTRVAMSGWATAAGPMSDGSIVDQLLILCGRR
jgi:hypothetical protein